MPRVVARPFSLRLKRNQILIITAERECRPAQIGKLARADRLSLLSGQLRLSAGLYLHAGPLLYWLSDLRSCADRIPATSVAPPSRWIADGP
jgi:hypothetical protein